MPAHIVSFFIVASSFLRPSFVGIAMRSLHCCMVIAPLFIIPSLAMPSGVFMASWAKATVDISEMPLESKTVESVFIGFPCR